jgi:hypothetical protein
MELPNLKSITGGNSLFKSSPALVSGGRKRRRGKSTKKRGGNKYKTVGGKSRKRSGKRR